MPLIKKCVWADLTKEMQWRMGFVKFPRFWILLQVKKIMKLF